jgi:hypothetical protein
MVIRDPDFWRRFSTAVHLDDAAKEELAKRPEMKHSYVDSFPSAQYLASPALSPVLAPANHLPVVPKPAVLRASLEGRESEDMERPMEMEEKKTSRPNKLSKSPSTASRAPLLPRHHSSAPKPLTPSRRKSPLPSLHCPSTLSLTGRPRSQFKSWTVITGGVRTQTNLSGRDSWLESQTKKSRQRTWICWCFWIGLLALVAGVVVTVLVLRSKNII